MASVKKVRPKPADRCPRGDDRSKSKVKPVAASKVDEELDQALEQTFPASDPVAMESTLMPGGRR